MTRRTCQISPPAKSKVASSAPAQRHIIITVQRRDLRPKL